MKVCLVNTYEITGGAAVASRRLLDALNTTGKADARLLVMKGKANDDRIQSLENKITGKIMGNLSMVRERMYFNPRHNGRINAFYFSPANTGIDITNNSWIQEADIIHLHWINLGFLSIKNIEQLSKLGKPIVWTLHDMWAFTGGCHYSDDCENFVSGCGQCISFLKKPSENDLTRKLNQQKKFFKNFHFVTCSKWLKGEALRSSLLKEAHVESIPNPIDTNLFYPRDKKTARIALNLNPDKRYILFGAANLDDYRKGFVYLVEAIKKFAEWSGNESIEILLFGRNNLKELDLPLKVNSLGTLNSMDTMANIYSAADTFVIPSLQDNLPNTVMESMACGTPVVAFESGGIPEMVDHEVNGYIAGFKDTDDLAQGIQYVLQNDRLGSLARQKVLENYMPEKVANQYGILYHSLL